MTARGVYTISAGTTVYVGKSHDVEGRIAQHHHRRAHWGGALYEWLREAGDAARFTVVATFDTDGPASAFERQLIASFRDFGFNVLNKTRGGESFDEDHRSNLGQALRGRTLPSSTRAKMSAIRKGRPWSASRRAALTPEARAAISAASTGRQHTSEARAKISSTMKARFAALKKDKGPTCQ